MSVLCYGCMELKNQGGICSQCGYSGADPDGVNVFLKEGSLLNQRYSVGRVLGQGGFGITYIGFDQKLNIKVAIKEYLPSYSATRGASSQQVTVFSNNNGEDYQNGMVKFLNEAQVLAKYNNYQGIVSVFDVFTENNTAYFVMEYVKGTSLDVILKNNQNRISEEIAVELMIPVLDALNLLHDNQIIHRDISPDNIYYTESGIIKLLDFGSARYATTDQTKSMTVVLKEGFAPPEQYDRKGAQGPWTDVYACAATLYNMITGVVPPSSLTRASSDTLQRSSKLGVKMLPALELVLNKALALEPKKRYKTVKDFKMALITAMEQKSSWAPRSYVLDEKDIVLKSKLTKKIARKKHHSFFRFGFISGIVFLIVALILTDTFAVPFITQNFAPTSQFKILSYNPFIQGAASASDIDVEAKAAAEVAALLEESQIQLTDLQTENTKLKADIESLKNSGTTVQPSASVSPGQTVAVAVPETTAVAGQASPTEGNLANDASNYQIINQQNASDGRRVFFGNDVIYYQLGNKIFKSSPDGKNVFQITDLAGTTANITVIDEKLYFISKTGQIFLTNVNGSEIPSEFIDIAKYGKIKLQDDRYTTGYAFDLSVYRNKLNFSYFYGSRYGQDYTYNNFIGIGDPETIAVNRPLGAVKNETNNISNYFLNEGKAYFTYKNTAGIFFETLDTHEQRQLSTVRARNILVRDNNVYYIDEDLNAIYQMQSTGSGTVKVLDNVSYFNFDARNLYYISGNSLYKRDFISGEGAIKLTDSVDSFFLGDGYAYYYKKNMTELYRVPITGGAEELIAK